MKPYDDEYEYDESDNIKTKGRFDGEPAWVPLLWDRAMSGNSDTSATDGSMAIFGFKLNDSVAALAGLQPDPDRYLALWESDDGGVTHMVMSEDELDAIEPSQDDDFGYLDFGGEGG